MRTKRMLSAIALGLAAGGATGNVIDRLNWGAVADFLNVSCCGIRNPWSFNVADIAVFGGFALLLLQPGAKPAPTPLDTAG
jgi:signal peptidase II